jgi:transcriptional regulator with PAS, ATPase and Fis domain
MIFTDALHKTLKRQIRTNLGENFEIPPIWQNLLKAISDVYTHLDEDRILSERAESLSSKELMAINKKVADETVILQATLNATTDAIMIMDKNYKVINYNNLYIKFWNIPAEIMALKDIFKLIEYESKLFERPEEFIKKSKENYEKLGENTFDILEFKDGRIHERRSQPLNVNGIYFGRVFSYRDVTDQKKYEIQLKSHSEDLEKINSIMVNRELKMIELKKENNELRKKLGMDQLPS